MCPAESGNSVLRYLAIMNAARDFGVSQEQIEAVAGRFATERVRCGELADALGDLIVGRAQPDAPGWADGLTF